MYRHTSTTLSLLAFGVAACAPQNAVLTEGEYIIFLSESTSNTVLFESVKFDDLVAGDPSDESVETFQFDCRCELANADLDNETCEDVDAFGGCTTCDEFQPDENGEVYDPTEDGYLTELCWAQSHIIYDDGMPEDPNDGEIYDQWNPNPWDDSGNGAPAFAYELWLHRDKFRAIRQPLAPWRGEAIITTEGDFQVTFHHEVGGSDFRFAFVIDPDFQPQECVGDGDAVSAEDVDGDWIENWSADETDGSQLWFLNAGAYQFNPSNMEDAWFLPQDWRAGYAEAKFGEEVLFVRGGRYGNPFAYEEFEALGDLFGQTFVGVEDLFYFEMLEGDDPVSHDGDEDGEPDFDEMAATMDEIVAVTQTELSTFGWDVSPKRHLNTWRAPDGFASGLDGWGELHYNWVKIFPGSTLEVGGAASGEFELVMQATDSQSRLFLRGTFKVDEIKKEKWGAYDIDAIKLEENDATLCVPR